MRLPAARNVLLVLVALVGLLNLLKSPKSCSLSPPSISVCGDKLQRRFALVLPFVENDVLVLRDNILRWPKPCAGVGNHTTDIIFYFNSDLGRSSREQQIRTELERAIHQTMGECIRDHQFLSADLTAEEDGYPHGISLQWYKLMLHDFPNAFPKDYEYFFWMEHDVIPIRPLWLDKLRAEVNQPQEFFLKGSIFRGDKSLVKYIEQGNLLNPWLPHINGNAFYRVGDSYWRSIIQRAKQWNPPSKDNWAPWDTNLWVFMHDYRHFPEFQHYAHKIQYTELIQNLGEDASTTEEQRIIRTCPGTYLIHGNKLSAGRRVVFSPSEG
jgi:hypothetical protein